MSQLRAFVERIERLQEEKRSIEGDIKEVYAEIASNGYDKKIVREVVKRRGKDQSEISEFEGLLSLYEAEISGAARSGTPSATQTRDAREGQSRIRIIAQEAPTPSAAQAEGATGSNPGQGDDDTGGEASPAETQVHKAAQSSQFGTGATGAAERVNADAPAPPRTIAPGRQYEPTPIPTAAEIDLTIPAHLDRCPQHVREAVR